MNIRPRIIGSDRTELRWLPGESRRSGMVKGCAYRCDRRITAHLMTGRPGLRYRLPGPDRRLSGPEEK